MTRLTQAQAVEFLESIFVWEPDEITATHVEAFIMGASMDDVQIDLEQFCASYGLQIDPDSVQVTPDHIDATDMVATKIVIRTASPSEDKKEMVA